MFSPTMIEALPVRSRRGTVCSACREQGAAPESAWTPRFRTMINADYCDTGTTKRRHVKVQSIINIGKEANRREEQSYVGAYEPESELEYGLAPDDRRKALEVACQAADEFGQHALAEAAIAFTTVRGWIFAANL